MGNKIVTMLRPWLQEMLPQTEDTVNSVVLNQCSEMLLLLRDILQDRLMFDIIS